MLLDETPLIDKNKIIFYTYGYQNSINYILAMDQKDLTSITKRAKKTIRTNFSSKGMLESYQKLFNRVIKSNKNENK